jgi:hypothetical protein
MAARGARRVSSVGMGVSGRPSRRNQAYAYRPFRLCVTALMGMRLLAAPKVKPIAMTRGMR